MANQHPDIIKAIAAYREDLPKRFVVLQRDNKFTLVQKAVWDERDAEYGGSHVPWARQLLKNGWKLTDKNPADLVDRINARRAWASYRYKTTITDVTFKAGVM